MQLGAKEAEPVGARFGKMGDIHQQAGIDMQFDPLSILGEGWFSAQRLVFALLARLKACLVPVGSDHFAGGANVDFTAICIDDDRIAFIDPLHDTSGLPDGGNAEGLGDNGNMTLTTRILDHQAAQARAVVVEQICWTHGAGDQNGVMGKPGHDAILSRPPC